MNKQLKRYLTITLGTCISGVALNAFFLPHHLLSGGITGLGMILYYLFGWQVSLTNILFNIPKLMSRNYFISGIYGTLVLSFFLQLFAPLQQLTQVHDPMLSCIAGGVLHGIGLGTLYRVGGSTGGSDIIGAIVQKFYSISIGTTGFLINIVLLTAGAFFFGLEPALYTLKYYHHQRPQRRNRGSHHQNRRPRRHLHRRGRRLHPPAPETAVLRGQTDPGGQDQTAGEKTGPLCLHDRPGRQRRLRPGLHPADRPHRTAPAGTAHRLERNGRSGKNLKQLLIKRR